MDTQPAWFSHIADIAARRAAEGDAYLEFWRVASMSAGLYVLGAGAEDRQTPHKQDELYVVLEGKARMRAGTSDQALSKGSIVFVAAGVAHRFYDIEEALSVLVFFAPAEAD